MNAILNIGGAPSFRASVRLMPSPMANITATIQAGHCPTAEELCDFCHAVHAQMVDCDVPELQWMAVSFEDMADNITFVIGACLNGSVVRAWQRPSKATHGTQTFHYCLGDVPLEREIYWEAAERGSWNEPGWPAQATLESAECGGINIIEILSPEQREEIEGAFLEQQ